jgi:hypothetical protein
MRIPAQMRRERLANDERADTLRYAFARYPGQVDDVCVLLWQPRRPLRVHGEGGANHVDVSFAIERFGDVEQPVDGDGECRLLGKLAHERVAQELARPGTAAWEMPERFAAVRILRGDQKNLAVPFEQTAG